MASPIKSYSIEGVKGITKEAGLPAFRANQILSWLYEKKVDSYEEMTNLPKSMREQLSSTYPLFVPDLVEQQVSIDGSRKYLLKLQDGALVETVGLPSDDGRLTVCCSTQSGCGMGCAFCATGKLGLARSLAPGEITDQVALVEKEFSQRVTNVVLMGQGEPFLNYESTMAALRILNHPKLFNIGARHITVSTCGVIAGIEKFSKEEEQFTLAVSLHSALQVTRDMLMPGVSKQRLADLKKALKAYTDATNRRVTFEYALIEGVNDNERELDALVSYCRHMLCHVNLITLNNVEGSPFKASSRDLMAAWKEVLESVGIAATLRKSQGQDIAAACGQLSSQSIGNATLS